MSRGPAVNWTLRPGRDADAEGIIALVGACWAEYPGCVMDLDGEVPELRALAGYYAGLGGACWVAEAGGTIVGMIGTHPLDGDAWEICKVYAAASSRGQGLAQALLAAAEAFAREQGAGEFRLWSDTRFTRAHAFYEKASYVRRGPIRVLGDKSNSLEYAYAKPACGVVVWPLDAAGADSAGRLLAGVLKDCVDAGASVSFLPPLDRAVARAFWQQAGREVANGGRLLLAGWVEGVLAGCVSVNLAMPPNQPHRGDVQKLLVGPAARRHGLGRRLLRAAEQAAQAAGRSLLVLDTRAGDAAEPLYRDEGWIEAGRIPDYARNPDGSLCATVFFYKKI